MSRLRLLLPRSETNACMPLDASRTNLFRIVLNDAAGRRPDGEYLHTIAVYVRPRELTCVRFEGIRPPRLEAPGNEERP